MVSEDLHTDMRICHQNPDKKSVRISFVKRFAIFPGVKRANGVKTRTKQRRFYLPLVLCISLSLSVCFSSCFSCSPFSLLLSLVHPLFFFLSLYLSLCLKSMYICKDFVVHSVPLFGRSECETIYFVVFSFSSCI